MFLKYRSIYLLQRGLGNLVFDIKFNAFITPNLSKNIQNSKTVVLLMVPRMWKGRMSIESVWRQSVADIVWTRDMENEEN